MRQTSVKFCNNFLEYIINFSERGFVNNFYGIKLKEKDEIDLKKFVFLIQLKTRGYSLSQISKIFGEPKRRIENWLFNKNLPPIIRLMETAIKLQIPKTGTKLLSINSTRGGVFSGPWITVPEKIKKYEDVDYVFKQLPIFRTAYKIANMFDLKNLVDFRCFLFAYFLGILVGDASKMLDKRRLNTTRRIGLSLTKRYPSNEKLGDFTCLCINSLGLRMKRIKDGQKGKLNIYPFYRWASQSSMFFEWIFNVCLGLKDTQLTTYNPIKAKWLSKTPRNFKIWFLQGLADSDGFVDLNAQQVGIITQPNTKLIKSLFEDLEIKSKKRIFDKRLEGLMISLQDAYKLPIFNAFVKSYRFQLLEKLVNAKRIQDHWPKWLSDKVNSYLKDGLSGTTVAKKILNEFNIAIRTKQIYRRGKRMMLNGS